ncbi:1-deoxy-D-xylulose-5-phosphate reductoisomerase [Candidatus Pelagibacter bacterium nBUS_30]|uniref:1-deoxy-D-xylulose-5-phosphate reductoisomerase n=1 Tax=Candidatus Pelagibacter bacterium nBUS_30 TaxID=3374191 RepID=UPI003EB9241B
MKKKIAIIGSTGSIGKTLFKILEKNKSKFEITLLTANKNYKTLLQQAKKYKVSNLIITNEKSFKILKNKTKDSNLNIFNDFKNLDKIFTKKIDYVMSSIIGIDGLEPTFNIIKFTKNIAIANKESIICGWNLIKKELEINNTKFIPVDSEHFSLWYGLKNQESKNIEKIILTASGGPFSAIPLNKFEKIKITDALKHPNWKMGKKISIDSATMINKLYEVIEAKNIFNIPYKKIKILIHPKSYVHALLKFSNGMIQIIAHDTTMKIPIFNTLYFNFDQKLKTKNIDINNLNNLNFQKVNLKRYPVIKLLNFLPNKPSLFETVIVSANDTLVNLFLKKEIKFTEIHKKLFDIIKMKEFLKFKKIRPNKVNDILDLNHYVRLKTLKKVYKNQQCLEL